MSLVPFLLLVQAAMPGPTMAVRVESLLARTPIPREGEVAIFTTASADTVYVGDQVEIMTTAWFPAAVRERLRRPPTLRPPSLNGVWSLPVVTLPGVAASRQIGETAYDLFASHQVVFPVTPGRLVIPPADLAYAGPGPRQFFGDERREERRSRERAIVVLPLPAGGRPADFAGPVGRGLRRAWRIATPNARVGELLAVDILVNGEGNLSLWGAPAVEWPRGVRVYPDRVDEAPDWRGARLGGTRRFRFLLLPDSAGTITLPAIRLAHFDPLQRAYRTATAAPVLVPILPSIAAAEPRPLPALLLARPAAWPHRLVHRQPWLLFLAGGLAPLLGLGVRRARGRAAVRQRPPPAQALTRFERALDTLTGSDEREAERIVAALRRAGVEREESEQAAHLHDRLRQLRYARPETREGREETLAEEAAQWLARLPRRLGLRHLVGLLIGAGMLSATTTALQTPSPEALNAESAREAASTAQRARLRQDPGSAAAWHNLGAMRWMARDDAAAAAAWLEAYRLAPRSATVRRSWNDLALNHQQVRSWTPRLPVTPEELIISAVLLWLVTCLVSGWSPRWRTPAAVLASTAVLALAVGLALRHRYAAPSAFTTATVPVREAPHGLASAAGSVSGITMVSVEATDGAWLLIRAAGGVRGWIPAANAARVRGLD